MKNLPKETCLAWEVLGKSDLVLSLVGNGRAIPLIRLMSLFGFIDDFLH